MSVLVVSRISDPAVRRILLPEEPLMVACIPAIHLYNIKKGIFLTDIVDQNLFLYPSHPETEFFYPGQIAVFRI